MITAVALFLYHEDSGEFLVSNLDSRRLLRFKIELFLEDKVEHMISLFLLDDMTIIDL